jgi:phosphoribosylformylglycinamidine (FGAM) synthase-like enzyme
VFEQYDQLVGSRTVKRPGLGAAVLRLDGSRGLAVSLDGPPPGERDPFRAGWAATMEAALNVACAGGEPLALTDCLNFGNPERAEIGWELAAAIDGIARAADELGIPVVSGNVSLYNETGGRPIPPTPAVGCVGLVRDVTRVPGRWRAGDRLVLLRGEGAGLVGFVWRAAHRFTLALDVRAGEGARALEQAARWSGTPVSAPLPPAPPPSSAVGVASDELSLAGSGPGVLVALAPDDDEPLGWGDAVELGTV